jgi:hypothetical protein
MLRVMVETDDVLIALALFLLGMLIDAVALVVALIAALLKKPRVVGVSLGIIGGWLVAYVLPIYCFECRVVLSRLGAY